MIRITETNESLIAHSVLQISAGHLYLCYAVEILVFSHITAKLLEMHVTFVELWLMKKLIGVRGHGDPDRAVMLHYRERERFMRIKHPVMMFEG